MRLAKRGGRVAPVELRLGGDDVLQVWRFDLSADAPAADLCACLKRAEICEKTGNLLPASGIFRRLILSLARRTRL
jgi:hypothetical protein